MAQVVPLMVKMSGSPGLIAELQADAAARMDEVKVQSAGPSEEVSRLKLGLGDVATMVALVNGVATFAKFAYAIYEHFKQNKSEELTVQTPLRTVVILASDATSVEQVKAMLDASLKP
jgi:hypothetical protein